MNSFEGRMHAKVLFMADWKRLISDTSQAAITFNVFFFHLNSINKSG